MTSESESTTAEAKILDQKEDENKDVRVIFRMRVPEEDPEIAGLFVWHKFLDENVAASLAGYVSGLNNWGPISDQPGSRRVIHYGYVYDYRRMARPAKTVEMPERLAGPARLVASTLLGESKMFDQLIINEYLPGQGISAHVDNIHQFGNVVFCVCLGSGAEVVFTHPDGRIVNRWLPIGSAYAMTGKARDTWRHEIKAKKSDKVNGKRIERGIRYSLTYRTILFPEL